MTDIALVTDDSAFAAAVQRLAERSDLAAAELVDPTEVARITQGTVVVDIGDGADGAERLGSLRTELPDSLILVCVDPSEPRAVRRLVSAGAVGIVWRDAVATALIPTLRAVEAGQLVVPLEARGQIAPPELTTREKQVLSLVVMELSNGEIARKLFLTESTVKTHLGSAFRKLGVRSRAEAARAISDPDRGLGTGILAISGPALSGYKKPASD